jgi:hypothetical protein
VIELTKLKSKKGERKIDYGLVGILLVAKAFGAVIMKPVIDDSSRKVRLAIYKI